MFYHSLSEIFEGYTCYLLNFNIPLSVAEQAGLFKISENSGSCDEVIFLLTVPRQCFFCRSFLLFMFNICFMFYGAVFASKGYPFKNIYLTSLQLVTGTLWRR